MSNTWQSEIDRALDARHEQLVAVRRHMHAHPEVSGQEHETSLYLYQMLDDEGFAVRMGPEGRGLLVDARQTLDIPRMALRTDIDALRIHDRKEVDYRSQQEGVMHACGHDAHTAILVGVLTTLADLERQGKLPWPIQVRGIFEPSEETATGAAEMIQAGAMDEVQAILATHVDPSRCVGRIGLRSGALTANCDALNITIVGRGGHAARPHEAIDPIATAAQLINAIYLAIPRATDSQDAVVVTIGQITGGDNPNVIPEQVELFGTLRTLDQTVRRRAFEHIQQVCRGVAESTGTRIEVAFDFGIRSVDNDRAMTELVSKEAADVLGHDQVEPIPRPSMGSEDFSEYLAHAPGAMFRLGCAAPGSTATGLHTPMFDVDEACLGIGAKILARSVVAWFRPGSTDEVP